MSPLKIILLMRLYACKYPLDGYTPAQASAPAMYAAFVDFHRDGLLLPDVTLEGLRRGACPVEKLTEKGEALVQKLKAIEP